MRKHPGLCCRSVLVVLAVVATFGFNFVARAQTGAVEKRTHAVGELCPLVSKDPVTWVSVWPAELEISVHDGGATCYVPTDKPRTCVIVAIHAIPPSITEPYLPVVDKWIVQVGVAPDPGPTPPGPGPAPDVTIDNTLGVGQAAYDAAVKLADPAGAKQMAVMWRDAAQALNSRPTATDADIQAAIESLGKRIKSSPLWPKWQPWLAEVEAATEKSWNDTWFKPRWVAVHNEIAAALEAVK